MKTKVNKEFIEAMQTRLDEKTSIYDGEDNPKNYKNLRGLTLINDIQEDSIKIEKAYALKNDSFAQEKLIDIANRCSMLWERLENQ